MSWDSGARHWDFRMRQTGTKWRGRAQHVFNSFDRSAVPSFFVLKGHESFFQNVWRASLWASRNPEQPHAHWFPFRTIAHFLFSRTLPSSLPCFLPTTGCNQPGQCRFFCFAAKGQCVPNSINFVAIPQVILKKCLIAYMTCLIFLQIRKQTRTQKPKKTSSVQFFCVQSAIK